ncbi:MAG: DUF1501 domain-containing protein [Planctomycetes bacterium]|nr:DUF1501 domain-containing protein [Planctomycetota bacterium]
MAAAFSIVPLPFHADDSAFDAAKYKRLIQPRLKKHYYRCHGPTRTESGLRLDSMALARRGGDRGAALLPGSPQESLLFLALTGTDEIRRMPIDGKPLSATQRALIRRWIEAGAPTPAEDTKETQSDHGAFQRIVRPHVPTVQKTTWARNPIDAFVTSCIEAEGLSPSPETDPVTLIRRITLDVIGLPPYPSEIDDFLTDEHPVAYETVVERLLASPHFGERWGRHWLDGARYADSDGYNGDSPRAIWKYREGVIDALNADMPFDQFTIEQIAGDLLPKATLNQKIATGFHRNTLLNHEGGNNPEQYRVERIVDRVNTTGTVFLGLTTGRAECHSHKFDPISQAEFYELFAFFNNGDEPKLELPTPEGVLLIEAANAELAPLEVRLASYDDDSKREEEFEIWQTQAFDLLASGEISNAIAQLLTLSEEERSDDQTVELFKAFQKTDPEIATRIVSYEMAFRMQTSAPEMMDQRSETKRTLEMYGADPQAPSFARNCLLTRRRVERGLRFVQIFHTDWDDHGNGSNNLDTAFQARCHEIDRPCVALVRELKERGLLDNTLVIWGGEFGRTPQGGDARPAGRDHHIEAFSTWFSGGGTRPGQTIGETDDLGFRPIADSIHVNDFHATILHLLGLGHEKLTYRFQGRDFRLTDVGGHVVQNLLA